MSNARRTPAKRSTRKPSSSRPDAARFWLRRLLILGVIGTLLMVAIFFFAYRATTIPNPNEAYQAQATKVYYNGGKRQLGSFAIQNRDSIPLAEVPQHMQDAIVAAEDRTFWTNRGIDPKGILRAAFSNARGNDTQGASTITQQYVKILYLTQERTIQRKVKEAFLSLKVHNQQSKSAILEGYLNTIYFGRGAYGIQAASEAYFGKPASKINLAESAMLSAVMNSPNFLNPDRNEAAREALTRRYQIVLNAMVDMGTAEQSEIEPIYDALPKTAKGQTNNKYGGQRGFMLTMVKDELLRLGFSESEIEGGGLKVTTTFSRKAMTAAREAVAEQKPDLKGLHAAVATVDVKTGGLLGIYAGQDYLQSQLNWAKLGNSPGSSFKPFALAAGLEQGFSLKDTFEGNSPMEVGDTEIENQGEDGGSDYGSRVSLVKATEYSINTAYVDLTMSMDDGPQAVTDMAYKVGVPKSAKVDPVATVALGSATVGVIDMANAYSTFANGGQAHNWYVVQRVVRDSDGTELYKAPRKTRQAISEDIAADVTYALQQVTKSGSGTKVPPIVDRPVAGKTGTATRDDGSVVSSWFVGYTPQVSTAVMYTRGNGRQPLDDFLQPFFGGTYPALTFAETMAGVLEGVEIEDFPPPAFVDGEAPSSGHEPYTPPPPPPEPVDACPNLAGDQPEGTDCNPKPKEPVKNGTCSSFGYPADPDCPAPSPSPTPPPPTNTADGVCPPDQPTDPDCVGAPSPSPSPSPSPGNSGGMFGRDEEAAA